MTGITLRVRTTVPYYAGRKILIAKAETFGIDGMQTLNDTLKLIAVVHSGDFGILGVGRCCGGIS